MQGRLRPPLFVARDIPYTPAMLKTGFAMLALAFAAQAQAAIYKYVDAEGNITFTDRHRPGAVKVIDTQDSLVTTVPTPRKSSGGAAAKHNPSPASFPKVDKSTQNKRDDIRRNLLVEERNNEANALATVREQLANSKRPAAELARLKESQRLHEKNIEMLDKELARIK